MSAHWWTESHRACLVEHTVEHRVEAVFVDKSFGFSKMPTIQELGKRIYIFIIDYNNDIYRFGWPSLVSNESSVFVFLYQGSLECSR